MPWHRSKSNPRKVYNSRHEEVCICETEEQAVRLVAEANGEARPLPPPAPMANEGVPKPTDIVNEDECCSPRLTKALRNGMSAESWVCPSCGCTWTVAADEARRMRRWSPEVAIAIWR
jgi:hypothetical protein